MAEKQNRANAKGRFTRQESTLKDLLDIEADQAVVTPEYKRFADCWNRLNDAHDVFISSVQIDVEAHDDGDKYLDPLNVRYNTLVRRYAEYLKTATQKVRADRKIDDDNARAAEEATRKQIEADRKAADAELQKQEQDRKFSSIKAELEAGIAAFKGLTVGLKDTVVSSSSDSVKVRELKKVETEFDFLKTQLIKLAGVDDTKDITVTRDLFLKDAETVYLEFRNSVLKNMKDAASSTSGGDSSSSFTTKKEPVKLPDFSGDEKGSPSPFLTFPVWLKQWKGMIVDYEEKFRDRLLCEKLDAAARTKIIGFENDYEEALKRLEQYFGDSTKVVQCVVNQIRQPDNISENNYRGLVDYSTVLEQNYNRLLSLDLEHEMSNHSIMSVIVKKFPCSIEERWHDHLLDRSPSDKAKPFPVFIQWLSRQKQKWSSMISTETDAMEVYYGEEKRSADDKLCFGCGEPGHIRKFCKLKSKPSGGGYGKRGVLKVKKFHCALHKEDKSRKCDSNSCIDLRKMADKQMRVVLLNENKDCVHCVGDHDPKDCKRKDRVCGGGKPNRGCGKSHKLHELFCVEAQVCMMVLHSKSMSADGKGGDGVVLCIMMVRGPRGFVASFGTSLHRSWGSRDNQRH